MAYDLFPANELISTGQYRAVLLVGRLVPTVYYTGHCAHVDASCRHLRQPCVVFQLSAIVFQLSNLFPDLCHLLGLKLLASYMSLPARVVVDVTLQVPVRTAHIRP